MRKLFSLLGFILSKIGRSITFTRNLILNLLFISFIAIIILALQQQKEAPVTFADNTALVLNLNGVLVDQPKLVDPFDQVIGELVDSQDVISEIAISDVVNVINSAKTDNAISALILDLARLKPASLTKLTDISDALVEFKKSNKPIYAYGDYFSQEQYFLASFADEILLNPAGGVLLQGYGSYSLYFKDAIDKLNLSSHVFRVGTYKSFVEPFTRSDMSAESKEAKLNWLNQLWDTYTSTVANNRLINADDVAPKANIFIEQLQSVNGNIAQYALKQKLVDQLLTREQISRYLAKKLNSESDKYEKVEFLDYLNLLPTQFKEQDFASKPGVGIIFANGQILDGNQPPGAIGGKSLTKLLLQAKDDEKIKALVLRIDSPGGNAFASEQIRTALLEVKKSGKPVIVSMGSVAASGGYWIASAADEIWAKPTTITGSIGIFGLFATTEKLLAKMGIYSDGVGTTDYTGLSVNRELPEHMAKIIQMTVENGYSNFLNVVAEGRDMTIEEVNEVAQGRVWTGSDALNLGLIDSLGSLDDAIASAAEKAGVSSDSLILIQTPRSERDRLLSMFTQSVAKQVLTELNISPNGSVATWLATMSRQAGQLTNYSDPQGLYVECLVCEIK
ncbi:signal peptide peptidase SppA [Moritella viscosa]|uniref:signal peptide peptidase SppA n=1 Tax=Moritella viscosa TaxID=80854 RepID=UPI000921288E|nr:signal peptide peptidase SppA [Moritella viscosa]SHO02775.1 Putative protease IV [Moritella viscosa]SHO02906.1 Putative protease IV [Moritella viscosa]SHO04901.1 Putative protease IV [Moritella viscosa]SHO07977.1 Putative protease IV [Moritella viscosa]